MQRAEKLIYGLGGEKERWNSQINSISHTYDHIIGDVLISAGIVAYLGAFTLDYRQVLIINFKFIIKSIRLKSFQIKRIVSKTGLKNQEIDQYQFLNLSHL